MKHATTRMLFAYWDTLRGERAAPDRGEIEPGEIRHILADTFIAGDNHTNPKEWTGLKARLKAIGSGGSSVDGSNPESRVMANSQASGGGALSLAQLDIAIANVENPTHIIMPKILRDRFSAATRDSAAKRRQLSGKSLPPASV